MLPILAWNLHSQQPGIQLLARRFKFGPGMTVMVGDPVDTLAQIRHIIKKLNDRELVELILDLQNEFFALKNENLMVHAELAKLKREIDLQRKMQMRLPNRLYFQEGDDTPFCPICWESRGKAIQLRTPTRGVGGTRRVCQVCGQMFWEKDDERMARAASQH